MKRSYSYYNGKERVKREYNYIPVRYVLAIILTVFEVCAVIGAVIALCYYVPYFYIAAYLTEMFCVIKIISSDDNPDYKVPWLLFVLILPVAGFMLYFLFYSRKLKPKFVRRLDELKRYKYEKDDTAAYNALEREAPHAASGAKMLTSIADTAIFTDVGIRYFPSGEEMMTSLVSDLEGAESFIFMEYFIIEEGSFWGAVLDILKRKASEGVTVRVIYDDVGCMSTLPGDYSATLQGYGIEATPFSRLKGNADSEFNNRNHRKITVVDGRIGYTGGVNIADEYINKVVRFGHWKDTAIRLEGEAVYELTRLFLSDFGLNVGELPEDGELVLYPECRGDGEGYVIPFGDGPRPIYPRRVSKSVIQNMLSSATSYMYITTPYLIIDNEMCASIESAALRGVDVRIIVPHIPDKKLVFGMTRSYYHRLMASGVRIYEYEPGFIHAKSYVADGEYAMIGTVNLDYRSLVHHFENGVWMYRTPAVEQIKTDIDKTLEQSLEITPDMQKPRLITRLVRAVVRIFAPLL